MSRRLSVYLSVLVCLLIAPSLHATTARALSREDMVRESELILVGRVVDTRSVWIDRDLVTLATIEVSEALKGASARRVTITLPGGVDAKRKFPVAMTWPGAPRLEVREEVVVFLDGSSAGYTIAGFSQGKFSVSTDAKGNKKVSRDLRDLTLRGETGDYPGAHSMDNLSSFKADIQKIVAEQSDEPSVPQVQ
jgi:hypothetical protein